MYALEEIIKAIELYFRYGRKASAVIRELGYPDRKILVKWVREYEETGKLHERCAGSNRYSQEEKQEAVDFYLGHGKQIRKADQLHDQELRISEPREADGMDR